jgi:hypothetical protein
MPAFALPVYLPRFAAAENAVRTMDGQVRRFQLPDLIVFAARLKARNAIA